MKRVDAGVSGASEEQVIWSWVDLKLPQPWPEIIECLSPGAFPRPIQVLALGEHRILDSQRNVIISAPTGGGKSLVGLLGLLNAIERGGRAVLLEPLRAIARERAEELVKVAPRLGRSLAARSTYISPPETTGWRMRFLRPPRPSVGS